MKLSFATLALVHGALGEVISPAQPSGDCHADNCYRAVAGDDVRFDLKSRREDCSRYMAVTTGPASSTLPAAGASTLTALPVYASVCISAGAYSSACSCWGVTADKPTADGAFTAAAVTSVAISPLPSSAVSSVSASNSTVRTSSTPVTKSSVLPSSSLSSSRSSVSSLSSVSSTRSSLSTSKSSSSSSVITTRSSSTTGTITSFSSTSSTSSTISTSTTSTNSTGGCIGGKCGTYRSWACTGPLGDCLCGIDPDGKSFCFEDNVCSVETGCNLNRDCPASQRCVIGSCCVVGKCVVERKDGACGNVNSARALFRVRGEGESKRCEAGRNSGNC